MNMANYLWREVDLCLILQCLILSWRLLGLSCKWSLNFSTTIEFGLRVIHLLLSFGYSILNPNSILIRYYVIWKYGKKLASRVIFVIPYERQIRQHTIWPIEHYMMILCRSMENYLVLPLRPSCMQMLLKLYFLDIDSKLISFALTTMFYDDLFFDAIHPNANCIYHNYMIISFIACNM